MFGCRNTDRCFIRVIILVVIYDLMSKLKSTCFLNDLKSKVKVINKVKVIKKMKIAINWLKHVKNRKSHFQNFLINWTFFVDLVIMQQSTDIEVHCIYLHLDICSLKREEKNTCSSHSLGGYQVVLFSQNENFLINFIFSLLRAFNIAGSY